MPTRDEALRAHYSAQNASEAEDRTGRQQAQDAAAVISSDLRQGVYAWARSLGFTIVGEVSVSHRIPTDRWSYRASFQATSDDINERFEAAFSAQRVSVSLASDGADFHGHFKHTIETLADLGAALTRDYRRKNPVVVNRTQEWH